MNFVQELAESLHNLGGNTEQTITWIHVNDRLPTLYETVMFHWKSGNKSKISIGQLSPLAVIERGSKHRHGFQSQMIWEGVYQIGTEVQYWAPLPENPC